MWRQSGQVRRMDSQVSWRSRGCWLPDDKGREGTGSSIDSKTGLAGDEDIAGAGCVAARSTQSVGGALSEEERCLLVVMRRGSVKGEVMLVC
jgi:hypothetical protein